MPLPHYILDEHGEPMVCDDLMLWAMWMEDSPLRILASDYVTIKDGTVVHVSTIFLGIDHGFGRTDAPVLWETMVLGGELNEFCARHRSRAIALACHREMLAHVLDEAMVVDGKPVHTTDVQHLEDRP